MVCETVTGAIAALAAGSAVATAVAWCSWARDSRRLRKLASSLVQGADSRDEQVRRINAFVSAEHRRMRNNRHGLLPALGPTPVQVLEGGGDCADRSRLLSALLRQIAIDSSPAMLYGARADGPAVHTVVLARTESGLIVADPMFDLMFPRAGGGHHDVRQMIAEPRVLNDRLAELRNATPRHAGAAMYPDGEYEYGLLTTINWRRYRWSQRLARLLSALGHDPRLLPRPAALEDPMRGLWMVGAASSATLAVLWFASWRLCV